MVWDLAAGLHCCGLVAGLKASGSGLSTHFNTTVGVGARTGAQPSESVLESFHH